MGKRFWSLALTAALVAGVFTVLPAKAAGSDTKFFLRSVGCPAADPNPDTLSIVDQDEEIECNYTAAGIRNEIGNETGTVGAAGNNAVSDRELATRYWDTTDGIPLTLDATRPVTGQIFTAGASCAVGGVPCSPVGVSLGEVILDITLVGFVGETETELGVQTDTFQVAPGAPHVTEVDITPAAGGTFDRIELRTWVHGGSVGHGMIKTNGDASSFITIPTASGGPVVTQPPGKNDPPGKGKKKGCAKGKGKKKGACPGKKPPKKPKPPAAPSCPAYVPGEDGAAAPTSVVTTDFTEGKPLEVAITAPSTADDPFYVFQNIQVGPGTGPVGLFARYEFPVEEDHDIYLDYASGTEAAHAGGFNQAPFVPTTTVPGVVTFGTDGTGAGGHSEQGAEQLDGINTSPCGGYTLEMQSFLSPGGDMVLKLWLGEIQNEPAADGGGALAFFYEMMGL